MPNVKRLEAEVLAAEAILLQAEKELAAAQSLPLQRIQYEMIGAFLVPVRYENTGRAAAINQALADIETAKDLVLDACSALKLATENSNS